MRHIPVLLKETIDSLNLKPNVDAIDCTLGDGGHAEAILEKISPNGRLLGLDADAESLLRAKRFLYRFGERLVCARENFSNLKATAEGNGFAKVSAIIFDLGWSSPQFEERGRGFSFNPPAGGEPLDMRYHVSPDKDELTAAKILNEYDLSDLSRIFHRYGEEKFHRQIAEAVVRRRKQTPLKTTGEFVEIILQIYREQLSSDSAVPWAGGLHPATKVFQALRIEVNGELEALKQALPQAAGLLAPGGRLAVISFHSLEDRIVKRYFQSAAGRQLALVNKKPIVASAEELAVNPRARSAKLRLVEKI